MKKQITTSLLLVLLLVISTTITIFVANSLTKKNTTKPEISIVQVDGKEFQTTGAIPSTDINQNLAVHEMINLGLRGIVSTPQFKIIQKGGSNFTIELFPPYNENKTTFLNWLKQNGYSHINPDQFNYSNVLK